LSLFADSLEVAIAYMLSISLVLDFDPESINKDDRPVYKPLVSRIIKICYINVANKRTSSRMIEHVLWTATSVFLSHEHLKDT